MAGSRSSLQVFYDSTLITNEAVLNNIASAIDNRKDFVVSNASLGGDVHVGSYKYAAVYYSLQPIGSARRVRIAGEGQKLTFGTDIQSITYGPDNIDDPVVYAAAYAAFLSKTVYPVSNGSFGGDPQVNVVKPLVAKYYRGEGAVVTENSKEYTVLKWDQ